MSGSTFFSSYMKLTGYAWHKPQLISVAPSLCPHSPVV